ncbi:peptide ABC transporter substrate-binding protein [Acetonema longum]|uniref:Extracellular solute-binding protein family 5 n=1 Tax=Acetonema longum DSM 6540 TaxID=1009370 RepID=F7NP26_9FIRM|nr:peptide ABC transporter substrate-binding protein [Acetonema longum]EGO62149.1 extracellular solute-binding protein family 5 [Acetonema longum DSM 6540]
MKWNKTYALLLVPVFLVNLLAGCGGQSSQAEKVLRVANGAEPETLDPRQAVGVVEGIVLRQLLEGLATQDQTGEPVPGTAEKWEVSADGLTYKFFIRANAKWSNGDPVTAHDFEYSWKTTLSPALASKYAEQLFYVRNGEAYNKGIVGQDQVGVKALDDQTLAVTLEKPTPYFIFLTTFYTYFPVHKKTAEANPNWHADPKTYVGNGPFKMAGWVHNNKINLVKSDSYWNKAVVKTNKAELNLSDNRKTLQDLFENNQLDTVEITPPLPEIPRLLKENKLKILPYIGTYYYCVNVKKAPFDNVKVRKAFSLAIDRQSIVELITKGGEKPAMAWTPYGLPDARAGDDFRKVGGDYFKGNDIAEAKKLLAEAGYPDGKGLPTVTLLYNNGDEHKLIAEAVQEMWKKNLGVSVELTNQEWKVYLQTRTKGDFQLARSSWIGDYLDPMTYMDTLTSANGNNHTRWGNPQYDRLVKIAQSTLDPAVRMKAMHDAEKILMEDMPVIPVYFYSSKVLEKSNVKGIIRDALGAVYLREAFIE